MKTIRYLFLFLLLIVFSGGLAKAQSIGLRLPDTTTVAGTVLILPIYADSSLTGAGVSSYNLQLEYDSYHLRPEEVIVSGTICEGFGLPTVNTSKQGLLTIAGAGSATLEGRGLFLLLKMRVLNTGWTRMDFSDAKNNYFNEGSPSLKWESASILINSAPTILVRPEQSILAKGEHVQMEAWYGKEPYQWFVTQPGLANINSEGLLTATGVGWTKVVAMDAEGVRDTSGFLEIRPVRLSIPENLTQWEGSVVNVPILASSMTGLNLVSGSFRVLFEPTMLEPVSVDQTKTVLKDAAVAFNKKNPGSILVSFAGNTPIGGNDTLLVVQFRVVPKARGYSHLYLSDVLFNESQLAATSDGLFRVMNYPYSRMSPDGAELIVGESISMVMYGETFPPYRWTVSDLNLAEVSQDGVLTAKKRGQVTVTVVDSTGATVVSNPFIICDTRIGMKDSLICDYHQTVDFPILLERLPGDSIYSLQGDFAYDTTHLEFLGVRTQASVVEGWSQAVNTSGENVSFAFSGTRSIKRAGVLFYLQFRPKAAFKFNTWATIEQQHLSFNEGLPSLWHQRYAYIRGAELYEGRVYIDNMLPFSELCQGDTAVFHAEVYNVRNADYQWLVNDLEVAGASQPVLRITTLQNNDTVSCRVTSDDPCLLNPVMLSNRIGVQMGYPPVKPGAIHCDTLLIKGWTNVDCWVDFDPNVFGYQWILPKGISAMHHPAAMREPMQGNHLFLNVTDSAVSGKIYVVPFNQCGAGDSAWLYVQVKNEIQMMGPDSICSGSVHVNYSVEKIPGATSYEWHLPVGFTGSSDSTSIFVNVAKTAASGDVVLYAHNSLAERTDTISLFVTVLNRPIKPDTIHGPTQVREYSNGIVYSVDPVLGAKYYVWEVPNGFIGQSQTETLSVDLPIGTKSGWIKVYAMGECGPGQRDSLYVTVSLYVDLPSALVESKVYPNPFDEELHVASPLLADKNALIDVFDATGRRLMLKNSQTTKDLVLHFNGLNSGIYLIKISYEGHYELHRVVKR